MRIIEAIILGLIQGLTEFFPVSSSAHLLVVPALFDAVKSGLDFTFTDNNFDIILHMATFLALIISFRKEILALLKRTFIDRSLPLARNIILTSLPTVILGGVIFLTNFDERQPEIISAFTLIIVGLWLIWIDIKNPASASTEKITDPVMETEVFAGITAKSALIIGFFQAAALIRGVSRSGITFIGSLSQGLKRTQALDYSFLASLPVFLLLTVAEIAKLVLDNDPVTSAGSVATSLETGIAFFTAFATAMLAIHVFRNFVQKRGVLIGFGLYRIILGIIVAILLA